MIAVRNYSPLENILIILKKGNLKKGIILKTKLVGEQGQSTKGVNKIIDSIIKGFQYILSGIQVKSLIF